MFFRQVARTRHTLKVREVIFFNEGRLPNWRCRLTRDAVDMLVFRAVDEQQLAASEEAAQRSGSCVLLIRRCRYEDVAGCATRLNAAFQDRYELF